MIKRILVILFWMLISSPFFLAQGSEKQPNPPPIFVETILVQPSDHQQSMTATGTLKAIPGIVVRSEVAGRITKIYFKSGEPVIEGAPLIEINPEVAKSQLVQAQAEERLAELGYDRALKLYHSHYISKADFDKTQTDVVSTKAKTSQAEAKLHQMVIVAPFSGELGLSNVNVGDYVEAGQSIVNLQALDPIGVDFSIPEIYLSKVAVGQTVSLHSDAYPEELFQGQVVARESKVNQSNRTLTLRASIPNKTGKLLPGEFVEVTLFMGASEKIIAIPQTAVSYSGEESYVYTIKNGKAKKAPVILGDRNGQTVIVKTGLTIGDEMIASGQLKVQDGASVTSRRS